VQFGDVLPLVGGHGTDGVDPDAVDGIESESDRIYAIGAGVEVALPVSRQAIAAKAAITDYQYDDNSELDYTGYEADGTWDWVAGDAWYGELVASARKYRTRYTTSRVLIIPSLVENFSSRATANYRLSSRWELTGGVNGGFFRYESDEFDIGDVNAWRMEAGTRYLSRQGNSAGLSVSQGYGRFPNRPDTPITLPTNPPTTTSLKKLFGDQYSVNEVLATFEWKLGSDNRISGNLGYSFWDNDKVPVRDVDGFIGRISHDWSISSQLSSQLSAYQRIGPTEDPLAVYIETLGVEWQPAWQLSEKIGLTGEFRWREEQHLGDSLLPDRAQREDRIYSYGIGAAYQASRALGFVLSAREEQRNSNFPLGDYQDFLASLFVRFEF
jgi:hypothetical protein